MTSGLVLLFSEAVFAIGAKRGHAKVAMRFLGKIWQIIRTGEAFAIPRAVYHLARARVQLARTTPESIARLNSADSHVLTSWGCDESARIERISRAVMRSARLVPWRSDCLVQALAAQEWSAQLGIRTTITIQVGRGDGEEFLAHAVLKHNGKCVLGQTASALQDIYAPNEAGRNENS